MLKQSPSRNQKSRGSGTKQAFQICLVLAICIWLIYQSKQLYGNKVVVAVQERRLMKDNAQEMLILGRKNLNPQQVAEHHQDEDLDLEEESGFDQVINDDDDGSFRGIDSFVLLLHLQVFLATFLALYRSQSCNPRQPKER